MRLVLCGGELPGYLGLFVISPRRAEFGVHGVRPSGFSLAMAGAAAIMLQGLMQRRARWAAASRWPPALNFC